MLAGFSDETVAHVALPIRFTPQVILVPGRTPTLPPATHTNGYIIGDDRLLLVDPATPDHDDQQRLIGLLDRMAGAGRRLEAIALTHHHEDHVGAVEPVVETTGAPVWAHRRTADHLPRSPRPARTPRMDRVRPAVTRPDSARRPGRGTPDRAAARPAPCPVRAGQTLGSEELIAMGIPRSTFQNWVTIEDHEQMREQLDQWVASLQQRRPARGPAQDTREAIDIIVKHFTTHGSTLWGHEIRLPDHAGGGIRLVPRTNCLLENFFGDLKHEERRRSGHKNLGSDLEHLPPEAALAQNLKDDS